MKEHPWEDNLLENKLESDSKDFLKTLVAFANSVKPGHIAVLLIGESDNGIVQGVTNPDSIQKKIRSYCDDIYPPIIYRSKVYKKGGKSCIRVEVEHDGDTPHFGGQAWIRKGSENIKSSSEVFQRLIDLRSSVCFELSKWIGKDVSILGDWSTVPKGDTNGIYRSRMASSFVHRWKSSEIAKIISVNSYWVTFEKKEDHKVLSEPLSKLILNFDNDNNILQVIISF